MRNSRQISPRRRPYRLIGGLFAALVLSLGCRKDGAAPAPARTTPVSSTPATAEDVLGPRGELAVQAEQLALEGSRTPGSVGAEKLERAASLRERLYRRERRTADALAAIETLRELSRRPDRACAATLRRIVLEAELTRDPAGARRALDSLKAEQPACRLDRERSLTLLGGYRTEAHSPPGASPAQPAATSPAPDGVAPSPELPAQAVPARITRVEPYAGNESARVVVHSSQPARFSVGQVEDAGGRSRLYVDVHEATLAAPPSYEVGGLVERVRLGQNPGAVRIVLELGSRAERRVFYVPEPFRLVIDVSTATARRDPAAAGRRTVRRVVLDPGHGGNDPGAVGPNGLREKDVTLDIAHRAAPLLARQLGVTTLLTRDGDQYVPLEERIARANAFQSDLFVSIHCNSSEHGGGRAVMTFVLDETREDVAMRLAARENAASTQAAAELASALRQLRDPANAGASLHFAGLLQRAAIGSLAEDYPDIPDGGVKRAGFYVLAGARMPAVLFETSFISSLAGETRFNTADFRQRLADAIVNAVRAYREGL